MAATSLKLPDDLKRRVEQLAAASGQTPHALMVDAVRRAVERAELRARFAADADAAERDAMASGQGHALDTAFDYLATRVSGRAARRPRARSWRKSS